jgi:hypothetical protein
MQNKGDNPMPSIILSDVYDQKLRAFVSDFGQTRESIIQELIDAELERRQRRLPDAKPSDNGDTLALDPESPGSLYHTRIISASINGRNQLRPKWNGLRERMHRVALEKLGSFDLLRTVSGAHLKQGRYESEGFKYIPEGDFSIQGVDANWCWTQILELAQRLKVPVQVRFEWRDKAGAAHPGKTGSLEWTPQREDQTSPQE